MRTTLLLIVIMLKMHLTCNCTPGHVCNNCKKANFCPTCPILFRTCKKKNLHFQLHGFDYEKGIGFTVWTKIRLRPSKAFLGTREKGCLLPRSLGARPKF